MPSAGDVGGDYQLLGVDLAERWAAMGRNWYALGMMDRWIALTYSGERDFRH